MTTCTGLSYLRCCNGNKHQHSHVLAKQHATDISKGSRHHGSGLDEQQETVERDARNKGQEECRKEQTTVVEANRLFFVLVSHDKHSQTSCRSFLSSKCNTYALGKNMTPTDTESI